ncbi:MAG: hypothetical protein IPJ41_04030 [Phycisphaerales bacterium]|nr:hypothetical protein [Phycisphaerales bacterium]
MSAGRGEAGGAAGRGGARRAVRLVVQGVGFLLGLAMLGWCVRSALSPDNREQLAKLSEASIGQVAMLLALSAATLGANGLVFWATLRPVKRLRAFDVLATNALCTFLAYLPFKLGALTRIAIHNRRDKVPLLTIGAWFAAMFAVMLIAYVPMMGASLWRRGVDPVWWAAGIGGVAVMWGAAFTLARLFAGERGLARLHAVLDGAKLPGLRRLTTSDRFTQLHAGADMLASPGALAATTVLRLVDLVVISARFVVAGSIVGVAFGWEEAVLVASAYYLIGVVSPFGLLGAREAGTVWMAGALGLAASSGRPADEIARSLTVLTLFISGTESVVLLACAAAGVAWLRPDRLLKGRD